MPRGFIKMMRASEDDMSDERAYVVMRARVARCFASARRLCEMARDMICAIQRSSFSASAERCQRARDERDALLCRDMPIEARRAHDTLRLQRAVYFEERR